MGEAGGGGHRQARPTARCIIFTSYRDPAAELAAVLCGAHAYILKDTSANDLTSVVRAAATGIAVFPRATLETARNALLRDPIDTVLGPLTDRERLVRDLLAAGRSDADIAARLDLSERALRTEIAIVIAKVTTLPQTRRR